MPASIVVRRTQKGQAIVEAPASLIETLVRHGQPLQLVREDFVAAIAEHTDVELVENFRVRVDPETRALRVKSKTKGRLGARRRVGPSGLLLLGGRGLRGRGEGAAGEEGGEGTRCHLGCSAGRPDCSSRQIGSHCGWCWGGLDGRVRVGRFRPRRCDTAALHQIECGSRTSINIVHTSYIYRFFLSDADKCTMHRMAPLIVASSPQSHRCCVAD